MGHNLSILLQGDHQRRKRLPLPPLLAIPLVPALVVIPSSPVFADNYLPIKDLGLQTLHSANTGGYAYGLLCFGLLIAAVVGMGIWSAMSRRRPAGGRWLFGSSLTARDLFLAITFSRTEKAGRTDLPAYLRTMDMQEATMVSSHVLTKGETLRLQLGSLPDFPDSLSSVDSEVLSCRMLDDSPASYLVRLKFVVMTHNVRSPLEKYLANLANPHPAIS